MLPMGQTLGWVMGWGSSKLAHPKIDPTQTDPTQTDPTHEAHNLGCPKPKAFLMGQPRITHLLLMGRAYLGLH